MELPDVKRRIVRFIIDYTILIAILIVGLYVWVNVFQIAVTDYLDTDIWVTRHGWLGSGEFEIFGYVINYQFEGYSDYSFYYVHWGTNMVNGFMPYGDGFGFIEIDGVTNRNGAHMFPPLTSIFYALGILIPVDKWGIGLLLAALGFLTVFPVYGLGKELSGNRHVGEVAALTYVLSPNVLYHTTYLWTNPAPFIFFFFAGYYFLVRGNRHIGTLLIVTAALFKQTAWFLGIPLVVYLLMKERALALDQKEKPIEESEKEPDTSSEDSEAGKKSIIDKLFESTNEFLDIKGFMVSVLIVLGFVGAIFYPFLVAQPNLWAFLRLAMGSFPLESFTEVPGYGGPMRLQVLFVVAGLPELAQIFDFIVSSGGLLVMGVVILWGVMLLESKYVGKRHVYLRRLLFFTLLMMLWVNLAGPRGVYKYYFTLFAPFFSIFASSTMCTSIEERVPFSTSMIWIPFLFSAMILIPAREIYLAYVLAIFVGYALAKRVGRTWYLATFPARFVLRRLSRILNPLRNRISSVRQRLLDYAYADLEQQEVVLTIPTTEA